MEQEQQQDTTDNFRKGSYYQWSFLYTTLIPSRVGKRFRAPATICPTVMIRTVSPRESFDYASIQNSEPRVPRKNQTTQLSGALGINNP